jgi:predicted  nucleic acid-binding Zn-ribbon protein
MTERTNTLNEQLELLIRLQEIDRKRGLYKEAKEKLPLDIEASQKPLDAARDKTNQAKAALEEINKERKNKERDLQASEEKVSKLKNRLTELKTNKEYQAHLAEIESAKSEIGKIEEDLLLLMERGDALKKESAEEESRVTAEEKRFSAAKASLEGRLTELQQQAESLDGEERELLGRLEPKLLAEYRQLSSTRKGLAVVPLQNSTCSGCHFSLPPQLVAEAKKRQKILACTYCRRIVYWPKG